MDIGSGYAQGIAQAGQSLSGAIKGIMGGVNPQTGEVEQGVLSQNQTANDFIHQFSQMKNPDGTPMMSPDLYNSIMSGSLGSKQKWVGLLTGQFQTNMQSQLEQARQIAVARATAAAAAPYRIQEIQQTGAEQRKTQAVTQAVQGERKVVIGQPGGQPGGQTTSDSAGRITTSLGSALQGSGQPSVLDPNYKFNLSP
jgi:hypothetical protein